MFNFTQEERRVIIFLIAMALLGIGGNYFVKKFAGVKSVASLSQNLGRINLNTADKGDLMSISGIGEKLAERIISYRESQGAFYSLEELLKIKGITEKKYNKIKEELFIE
jgi:competence protein ComEA